MYPAVLIISHIQINRPALAAYFEPFVIREFGIVTVGIIIHVVAVFIRARRV